MEKDAIFCVFLQKKAISIKRTKDGVLCFKDSLSRKLNITKVYQSYLAEKNSMQDWVYMDENEIQDYLIRHAPKEEQKEERKPPSQFIAAWIAANPDWKISLNGRRITTVHGGLPRDRDMEDLTTAIQATVDEKGLPYKEGEINRAVKMFLLGKDQQAVATIFGTIKYDPSKVDLCDRWLKKIHEYFKIQESLEMFTLLMKHWGWQVKRKMLGRKVIHHLWINFYGAQGTGKTTFLNKLTECFGDLVSTTTISKIFDDTREIKRLTENYILIFDELALNVESEESGKLNADQKAILKSIITGDTLDARVYGTQQQAKRAITFSCISSANTHLYDILFDETSMRRFFEFHCDATNIKDFTEINKILQYSGVFWTAIDEDLDHGYMYPDVVLWDEVKKIQASYFPTKSSVYDWIAETGAKPGNQAPVRSYKAYRQFAINCGYKPKTMANFVADVKHAIPDACRNGTVMLDFTMTELCRKSSGYEEDVNQTPFSMEPQDPMKPNVATML